MFQCQCYVRLWTSHLCICIKVTSRSLQYQITFKYYNYYWNRNIPYEFVGGRFVLLFIVVTGSMECYASVSITVSDKVCFSRPTHYITCMSYWNSSYSSTPIFNNRDYFFVLFYSDERNKQCRFILIITSRVPVDPALTSNKYEWLALLLSLSEKSAYFRKAQRYGNITYCSYDKDSIPDWRVWTWK